MHIQSIKLENIKSFRNLTWNIKDAPADGWHVILGDNGSGKTTFLQAISLGLLGPNDALGLRESWYDWLRHTTNKGEICLTITENPQWDSNQKRNSHSSKITRALVLNILGLQTLKSASLAGIQTSASKIDRLWNNEVGWFSAAFGPYRRFSAGPALQGPQKTSIRLSRHLSVFEDWYPLTECLEWLKYLKFRELEGKEVGFLDEVKTFVNHSDFLPSGVRMEEVTSDAVVFRDANGTKVNVEELSDGYRSVLSMTFELIRMMSVAFGPEWVFDKEDPQKVAVSGVVLIDEVDAHLHPTWQKKIGRWLCEHFPNIQFIVTTHSPLICQAAERGSIFILPRAGSGEEAYFAQGEMLNRLLYGTVLDAYGTEAFGAEAATTRSKSAVEKSNRLAMLNNKELLQALTPDELEEQQKLRGELPSAASNLQ